MKTTSVRLMSVSTNELAKSVAALLNNKFSATLFATVQNADDIMYPSRTVVIVEYAEKISVIKNREIKSFADGVLYTLLYSEIR